MISRLLRHRVYVISTAYRTSESDALATVVLAQPVRDFGSLQNFRVWHSDTPSAVVLAQIVRDFDFLQNFRVWYSPHGCFGSGCEWFRFPAEFPSLTLLPWLSRLRLYVIVIIFESDPLITLVWAQGVRDINLLQYIRVWRSRHGYPGLVGAWFRFLTEYPSLRVYSPYGCPGSACTWFWFLTQYPSLTLSPRLSWLRMYVISISYGVSESNSLATVVLAQPVRDLIFLPNNRIWHSPLLSYLRLYVISIFFTKHSILTLSPRPSCFSGYVTSIFYKIPMSDTRVLTQMVRDFDAVEYLLHSNYLLFCSYMHADCKLSDVLTFIIHLGLF